MKQILFFLIICITDKIDLNAQNWVKVGTNENGQTTYLDKESITKVNNRTKGVWTKFDKSNVTLIRNGRNVFYPTLTYLSYSEYDCQSNTVKHIKITVKESNNNIIFSDSRSVNNQREEYIPENAIGRSILKLICN